MQDLKRKYEPHLFLEVGHVFRIKKETVLLVPAPDASGKKIDDLVKVMVSVRASADIEILERREPTKHHGVFYRVVVKSPIQGELRGWINSKALIGKL